MLSARAPPSPRCTALTAASCENHGAAPNFGTRVPEIFGGKLTHLKIGLGAVGGLTKLIQAHGQWDSDYSVRPRTNSSKSVDPHPTRGYRKALGNVAAQAAQVRPGTRPNARKEADGSTGATATSSHRGGPAAPVSANRVRSRLLTNQIIVTRSHDAASMLLSYIQRIR